jgi:malate dehydrogenase (oxaloacetate-decarboxylating)(NADP+)
MPRGADLLHDPSLNKGTAFTEAERDAFRLQGLLPSRVCDQSEQATRVLENYRKKRTDLDKYINLIALQGRNETLFYKVVIDNIDEMMPIIYTPVVGRACQEYGHIFRRSRGLFLSRKHRGGIADVLRNWPKEDIRVIVVTDGERILGLGDLGANGMGIPVGKLSLYTACAGIDPNQALPITLDTGTDNDALRNDPLYIGDHAKRIRGEEYNDFVDEFVQAVQEVFPDALIQFEDFATRNAIQLLKTYRDRARCFNDDIQGTAAVTLAGLYSASRLTGVELGAQTILFFGAGSAATGIADLVVGAVAGGGLPESEARNRCWFVDSKGLVVASRTDLAEHKLPYAHEHEPHTDLVDAIRSLKPTALIGVSGQGGTFTRAVLREMAAHNPQPIIFALSNPTANAEATAEEVYRETEGQAIFASGSPFDPVTFGGKTLVPGQGNNAYIFPGVGLGVVASGAKRVTDEMFFAAVRSLAADVSEESLSHGCLFPPLSQIRDVSLHIAAAVAEVAYDSGLATRPRPQDLLEDIRAGMYQPEYRSYV